ncbi:MAG TPA: hypothetical protein VHQ90_10965 [Thermoanaerobaculia bacterium]|nr:hypothetical protein [Thermoanaerobaculia bacterium]
MSDSTARSALDAQSRHCSCCGQRLDAERRLRWVNVLAATLIVVNLIIALIDRLIQN